MWNIREKILSSYTVNATALKTIIYYNTFRKTYKFLKKSQWRSQEQLEEYQLQQLSKLLHHAYENVPYYTRIFDDLGLKPNDIQSLQDLQKLPFLTKEIIREHVENLKATNYPESKFEYTRTGGSTGYPLRFYKEKGVWLTRLTAYTKIMMDWADSSFFDRSVFITGRDDPWKYQLFGRMLVLSSFYMNEEYLSQFIQKIRKLKPKYILTYPSAITILAKYMRENNLEVFPSVKVIICHAETLYEWQRDLIEETFHCKVHDHYGLREQTVLGGTCEHSNYYHMFPEYGILEIVDKHGNPITKEGQTGEIVGTGFHTYYFPFIRYKTGDLGVYTKYKCKCGRNYPTLKRIEGRKQEFIITKSKQLIPLTGIYGLIAKSSHNVQECQLYQDALGKIEIRILKTKKYSKKDSDKIKNNFKKRFRNEIDITIQFVNSIPRTDRGKSKFLIQKLPIEIS